MGRALCRISSLLAVAFWTGALLICAPSAAQSAAPYRPGEVIVKYRAKARPVDRSAVLIKAQARTLRSFDFIGAELIQLQGGSVSEAIALLRADPMVEYAEPNYELHALVAPNDPEFTRMYALRNVGQTGGTPGVDIRAVQAWDLFTGDPDLKIGVIDTGVDYTHPDLAANIWTNPGEIPGNGIDDEANGYVDDLHGYDFVNDDGDPFDDNGHGTHCSGTIAAVGNNGMGVVGVNWRAKVVAIKFLSAGGSGSTAAAIASVQYAIRVGVRLTSNSWGGGDFSQALLDAINAAGEAGQLFVAAAGNAATNIDLSPSFPVSYDSPYMVGVAATDHNDALAVFSNWGPAHVHLAAPGVSILSTFPGGVYGLLSGTSMATPHVAGAVGFVLGRFPGMSALLARSLILAGIDSVPALDGIVSTGGRLNLFTPVLEPDSIRPAGITDLAVIERGSNTLALAWTATGDDSASGRAVRYDLRYSTSPITADNFAAATPVPAPDPSPSGSPERVEVHGLAFNTTYYVAVLAVDEFSNRGPISNVVSGLTLGIPDVTLSPVSLFQELLTGATATQTLTLRNDGEGTLDWTIPAPELLLAQTVPHEYLPLPKGAPDPRAGDPVIGSSGGPDAFGYRWTDSDQPGGPTFGWVDITTVGTPVQIGGDDATSQPIPMGILFPYYGNTFTSVRVSSNGFLSFTDPSAPFSNQPLPNTGAPANMIAPMWDDLFLGVPSRVYSHLDGGRFIVSWEAVEHYGNGGPYTFQVILFPSGEIRFQYLSLAPPTDNATVGIQNGSRTIGLTTAFNTAYLRDHLAVRLSRGPDWLTVAPRSGRLAAGQSVPIAVGFNAVEALGGDYPARIDVQSNDPDEATATIPVTLRVIGAPDIVLEGAERTLSSTQVFAGDGATTSHTLQLSEIPTGTGVFELLADGDYGDVSETASLSVEGRTLGPVGGEGADCALTIGNFSVDRATLADLASDGQVRALVQNSATVTAFCVLNRHTVRLRYRQGADSLHFGEVFIGDCRAETLVVRNRGTDSLRVEVVDVSDALYTASPGQFVLGVGESRGIAVTFCPPGVGDRPASLTLRCNDPDAPTHTVALMGRGVVPPDIGVNPTALSADLLSGQSATRSLRIENTGGSDLRFDISQNTPAPATPDPRPASWVSASGDDPASSLRPAGYAPVAPAPRSTVGARALLIMDAPPWGTTSDQAVLTANDIPYDLIPASELAATDLSHYRLVIVASDQPNGSYATLAAQADQLESYVAGGGTLEFHAAGWGWSSGDPSIVPLPGGARIVYRLAEQNRVLIPTHPTMAGVPNPFSGTSTSHAFLTNLPDRALHVAADLGGNPTLAEYRHGLGVVLVSCHTLEFGFTSGQAAGVILINLIPYAYNYSPPWLAVVPARGTVPAGASLDLAVHIDTATLLGGEYRGEVRIASNDPDEAQITVPVDLRVTGVADIALSATALDFGTMFVGFVRGDTVRVSNLGTDTLRVAGITVDDPDYAVPGAGFVLGPGGRRDLPVTLRPTRPGPIEASLRVASDDPDEGTLTVALHAVALEPPVVGATPDSLSAALVTGQAAVRTLTVTNTGGSPLTVAVAAVGRISSEAIARQARQYERTPPPGEAPPWVPSAPTPNQTQPHRGPSINAGDYAGAHLYLGITDYGEIMPFQYPNGNEHLAVGSHRAGYTVAYQAEGAGQVAYAGHDYRNGVVPVSYREITNNPGLLVAEAVTRTQDGRLQITRTFTFQKGEKGVRIHTVLQDLTGAGLQAVVFKEWADLDVDGNYENTWDYDQNRHMVHGRRTRVVGIAGLEAPDFMDINGWNDYDTRSTTVEVPSGLYTGDGLALLHYELGDLAPMQSRAVLTAYGAADDLVELQQVMDRALVKGEWLAFDPVTLEVPAGGTRDVAVTFDPGPLFGGRYDAFIELRSNDPYRPRFQVPAYLDVTGVPDIALAGEQVELVSMQAFSGDAARTAHRLAVTEAPAAGGSIELVADGDYSDAVEQATLVVEGRILGQVGGTGGDCQPARAEFTLDAATLAALAADGVIDAEVQNTQGVNAFCDLNRHTVRVRYRLPSDSLRFGQVFLGQALELTITARNAGTDGLVLGSAMVEGTGFELLGASFPVTLRPGEQMALAVRFAPAAVCEPCGGTLTVTSSDPDEAVLVVGLAGSAAPPPDIVVTPGAIASTLTIPGGEIRTLTIANPGESELSFTLTPAAPAPGPAILPAGTAWPPDVQTSTGDPVAHRPPTGERDAGPLELKIRRPRAQSGSVLVIADGSTEADVEAVLVGAGFVVTRVEDDAVWNGTNPSPYGFSAVVLLDGLDFGDDMPVGGQQALLDYVSDGGGLILTEWVAFEVESGRYNSMRPLIPLTRTGGLGGTFAFGVTQSHPVTAGVSPSFQVTAGMSSGFANSGTTVVSRVGDGSPMTLVKNVGRGRVVEFSVAGNFDLFRPFTGPDMQRLLVNAADWVRGHAWLAVSPSAGTVPAGGSVEVQVRIDTEALTPGVYSDSISIASNDPDEAVVGVPVTLNASVVPEIEADSASLDFGPVFVGLSRTLVLQVRNQGLMDLEIASGAVSGAGYELVGATFPIRLGPSGQTTLSVRFAPEAPCAPCAGALAVSSNDPDEATLTVPLAGTAVIPPDIDVNPAAVLDTVVIPATHSRTLLVHNAGPSPLIVSLATQAAADTAGVPGWLSVTPEADTVEAGASVPFQVNFQTSGLFGGSYAAALRVSSNDPDEASLTVPVGLVAVGAPSIAASPLPLVFGAVFTNYHRDLALTLANDGTDTLRVVSATPGHAAFALVEAMFPIHIAPFGHASVTVRFRPTAACDPCSTGLVLRSNDPARDPFAASMVGIGRVPPDVANLPADVQAAAATTLGPEPMVRTRKVRIENAGGSPLEFSTIAISAADSVPVYASRERAKAEGAAPGAEDPDPRPGILGHGGPDRFGYRWRDSDTPGGPRFQWVDIIGTGTAQPLLGNDATQSSIDIGFQFPFYGFQFRRLNVCTNGFLSFTSTSTSPFNEPLPNPAAPNMLLAPFWDDLDFGVSVRRAWTHFDGARFIVTWDNVPRRGGGGPYTFQIILYPSGRIVYQYLHMGPPTNSATVGIQNNQRNDGLNVAFNLPYVHDSLAVEIFNLPAWLSATPASGTIPVGGSADLELRFDAQQLPDGDYTGDLTILTNDPDEPTLQLPCALHVGVMTGALEVDPNALNRNSNGRWVSADLEVPPGLDAHALALGSVRLQRLLPLADGAPTSFHDSDHDGLTELRCKFDREQLMAMLPDGAAVPIEAIAEVPGVSWFQALDVVRVMRPGMQDPSVAERTYLAGSQVLLEWLAAPDTTAVRYDLWYSANGGETWTLSASGLAGRSCVWTVPEQPTDAGRLELVALDGQGVRGSWLSGNLRIQASIAGAGRSGVPTQLGLRQLGENPARGDARLELALPQRADVEVWIYDVRGAAVRRLANRNMEPGWHTLAWDGRDDAGRRAGSGIYFVRLAAGGRQHTLRVALVR